MKFNVEIEIDWIDEESNIDDEVRTQIINGLSKKMEKDFLGEAGKKIAQSADKLLTAKTELLINTVLEKPVVISDGWNSQKEYESIYDMVEQRMTALYQGKLNNKGKCEKDRLLAKIENYVDQHIGRKIQGIESLITQHAKKHAANALKQSNLATTLRAIIPEIDAAIDK